MQNAINNRPNRKSGDIILIKNTRENRETRERTKRPRSSKPVIIAPIDAVPAPDEIRISGLSDQFGAHWILVSRGEQSAVARVGSPDDARNSMWRELADQELLFTKHKSKQTITDYIEDIREWPQGVYVATRAGYHCGAHVKPDGKVLGKPQAAHFRAVLRGPPVALTQRGTLSSWRDMVRKFAQDQVIYTTLVCASFTGPILELFPNADNVCLFAVGETSGGKSTGLDLYCTTWGAPHQQPGSIGISLRSTSVGIEKKMMARSAAAFAADEVNLLGRNTREQGDRVYDLAFMVSHGVEKERANDAARVRVQQSFVATSNTSLARLLDGQDKANAEAVLVRFLTLPADAGVGLGVFDSIPEGYESSQTAVEALKDAMVEHHGTAADPFLIRLARERRKNEPALKAKLQKYCARFLRKCHVDPADRAGSRRAKSFALIYAAGRLAREWKISPLKRLMPLLLEAYRRSTAADAHNLPPVQLSPRQRVTAYVEAHFSKLIDLDDRNPAKMSKKDLNDCAGFLKTLKGRRCLLVRARRWNREFGTEAHRLLDQLNRQGRLHATENLQTQTRVRANDTKDRVYAIRID